MRVVFAGTSEFAVPCLEVLQQSPAATLVAVVTQPDRPAGRGQKRRMSAVKARALHYPLAVVQPPTLNTPAVLTQLRDLEFDLLVVVAYGLMVPATLLAQLPLGGVNVHASLLPQWRGAAPIQRAIEAGARTTGVSLMRLQATLDSGPILARAEVHITPQETAATLHDRLAPLGARVLADNLSALAHDTLPAIAQDARDATYAKKLTRAEARLDWHLPAAVLARKIRAYTPWPIAHSILAGQPLRILAAQVSAQIQAGEATTARPGEIVQVDQSGLVVQTGEGRLCLTRVQKPGGRGLAVADLLNGWAVTAGMTFAPAPPTSTPPCS